MARKPSKPSVRNNSDSSTQRPERPMDLGLLERLVKLMTANDISAIDLRDGDKRVVLKRGRDAAEHMAPGYFLPPPGAVANPAPAPRPADPGSATGVSSEEAGYLQIKSPMVGTFYSASGPDSKPFVSVGSEVDEETDVCIIEAMKVFNNIKAECKGTIARVLVNNGETVEFGQVLFLVKP